MACAAAGTTAAEAWIWPGADASMSDRPDLASTFRSVLAAGQPDLGTSVQHLHDGDVGDAPPSHIVAAAALAVAAERVDSVAISFAPEAPSGGLARLRRHAR